MKTNKIKAISIKWLNQIAAFCINKLFSKWYVFKSNDIFVLKFDLDNVIDFVGVEFQGSISTKCCAKCV